MARILGMRRFVGLGFLPAVLRFKPIAWCTNSLFCFLDRIRLHSALGYRPPEEFEHAMASGLPPGVATLQFFRPVDVADQKE